MSDTPFYRFTILHYKDGTNLRSIPLYKLYPLRGKKPAGGGKFFADLATGRMTQENARVYVTENEKTLWKRFQKEMLGRDTGDWMWKKPGDPNQPMHVAYVLGGRIVAAFYRNTPDKARAVVEILSVTDYSAFLKKSGYGDAFKD